MTNRQKLDRKISTLRIEQQEARKAINDDEQDEAKRAEGTARYESLSDQLIEHERARIVAIDEEVKAAEEVKTHRPGDASRGVTSEIREYLELEQRAELSTFLDSSISDGVVGGAEKELRETIGATYDNIVPWPMLLTKDELAQLRADAVFAPGSNASSMQDPIIQAIFASSTVAFLGTRFESAGIGDQLEFVLTSGTPAFVAKAGTQDSAGSLTATTLTPRRLTHAYRIAGEDMMRVQGLESALRADLPRAMANQLDAEVLVGGAAPKFPKGILNSLTAPTVPTVVVTFATAVEAVAAGIDGQYARNFNELKLVVGAASMRKFWGLIASNTAVSAAQYIGMSSAGIMATSNIPAVASDLQHAILCKTGPGMTDNAVGKVWGGGIRVIRDETTGADKAETRITATAFYDYAVLRTDGFAQLTFKVS